MGSTLLQLRTKVLEPIDAIEAISDDNDSMYSVDEVNRYINKGIQKAEALIHNIYEDYFLAYKAMSIVSGTSAYVLPTDMYLNKIRKILFDDGTDRYSIDKIKHIEKIQDIVSGDRYKYKITNNTGVGNKINIFPTPTFTNSTFTNMYYIRKAAQLVTDSDEIDIPEFEDFVVLYARRECLKKQIGNPMLEDCKAELKQEGIDMVDTLGTMIPDEDNTLELDTSFYEDFYNTEIL